jgi:hypothetical protein
LFDSSFGGDITPQWKQSTSLERNVHHGPLEPQSQPLSPDLSQLFSSLAYTLQHWTTMFNLLSNACIQCCWWKTHIISFGIWIMTKSPFIMFLSCQPRSMEM